MIPNAQALVRRYEAEFQRTTGETTCAALEWAKAELKRDANQPFEEIMGRAAVKMQEGTADSGWFLGPLALLWNEMSEDQRLLIMALLRDSGALKVLLNRQAFPAPFSQKEKAYLTAQFRRSRSEAAVRRVNA